jgi:hypothetical protein
MLMRVGYDQGLRTLSWHSEKDFRQEGGAPAGEAALHD